MVLDQHNPKLNARGIECVLVGYSLNSKAYRCYDRRINKIHKSYHVRFLERHGYPIIVDSSTQPRDGDEPTTIGQIKESSTTMPLAADNDDIALPIIIHEEDRQKEVDALQDEIPKDGLHRSDRTRVPTAKASSGDPPMTRGEQAVQESCDAATRV